MSQAIDVEQMLQDSSVRIDRGRAEKVRERLFGRTKPIAPPRYELREELDRGQFGRVILAFDHELRREVALKVVHYETQTEKARIEREAEALARISHSNVVQVHDKGSVTEGTYFLALEYIKGQRLDRWLGAHTRPLGEILRVFLQIAEGLVAAHSSDLVHRDFKPANVVITPDGRACVLDFGLAKLSAAVKGPDDGVPVRHSSVVAARSWSTSAPTSATLSDGRRPDSSPYASASLLEASLTEADSFVGTRLYASPEQLDHSEVDARSDQFSYCVTLFEAAYGYRPFSVKSYPSKGSVSRPDRRKPIRRVPRWLRKLLLRGLAPDPCDRFRDLQEIAAILRRHIGPLSGLRVGIAASLLTGVALVGSSSWWKPPEVEFGSSTWDRAAIEQAYGPELRAELDEYQVALEAAEEQYADVFWPDLQDPRARCLRRARTELDAFVRGLESVTMNPDRLLPSLRPQPLWLARMLPPQECLRDELHEPTDEPLMLLLLLAQRAYLQGNYETALVLLDEAARAGSPDDTLARLELQRGIIQMHLGHRAAWDTLAEAAAHGGDPVLRLEILAKQLEAGVALDRSLDELRVVADAAMELDDALDVDQTETQGWLAAAQGHASVRLGQPHEALRHYDDALQRFRSAPHPERQGYAIAFVELSRAFAETWVPPADAATATRALQALEKLEAYLPAKHPQLAAFRVGVGAALANAGDPAQARQQFEEVRIALTGCTESCEPGLRAELELFIMDLNDTPLTFASEGQLSSWERRANTLDVDLRAAQESAHPPRKADAARAWSAIMQVRAKLGEYDRAIDALDRWMDEGASHDHVQACDALTLLTAAITAEKFELSDSRREIIKERTTDCGGRAPTPAPRSTDREERRP